MATIHPIAFCSRSMQPAELNYEIYDKELLAIFEAFRQWRNYLEGSAHGVLSTLRPQELEYFATTKQLTRHQVGWSEYLSGFNYLIRYRAGRLGTKPDALTHHDDVYPQGENAYVLANPITFSPCSSWSVTVCNRLDSASLLVSIRHGLQTDPIAQSHLTRLRVGPDSTTTVPATASPDPRHSHKMATSFAIRTALCPRHQDIRLDVLRSHHDHRLAGHLASPRQSRTSVVSSTGPEWLPSSPTTSTRVSVCSRSKSSIISPLASSFPPIGERPWDSISMTSSRGYPCPTGMIQSGGSVPPNQDGSVHSTFRDIDAEDLARIFLSQVFAKHGTPTDIVSDQGKHFISCFWRPLCQLLGIKANLSTAYHQRQWPTERVNQVLEQYLRVYINYHKTIGQPPTLAEFAYNNTSHSATMGYPFFANKGFILNSKCPLNLWCQILLTRLQQTSRSSIGIFATRYLVP